MHYVNDYSPVFTNDSYVVNVTEGIPIGYQIIKIHAKDNDIGSQGDVFYALNGGNIGNSFKINRTSGVITAAGTIDRETTPVYNLIVKAFDGAVEEKVRFTEKHLMVNIRDRNDNAPQFTKNGFRSVVKETADINDVILLVGAMDRDAGMNAVLRFSITSGNSDGYFDINPTTGEIVVNRSLDLEGSAPPALNYSLGKVSFLIEERHLVTSRTN